MDTPISLWRRDDAFNYDVDIPDTLSKVVSDLFSRYENLTQCEEKSCENQGSNGTEKPLEDHDDSDTLAETASVSSLETVCKAPQHPQLSVVELNNESSEETMTVDNSIHDIFDTRTDHHPTGLYQKKILKSVWGKHAGFHCNSRVSHENTSECPPLNTRCLRCEAYDAHCKSAADNYRRTLSSYTKTVSELMLGFRKVLERYPELKVESGDDHLRRMVQAVLGRNNLVQEMVRLAAKREALRDSAKESMSPEVDCNCHCDSVTTSVIEALKTCYSDSQALRMVLESYTNLYVRYLQVWSEMSSKISRDGITVMEFVHLTQNRPGVSYGEPWSEAKAYVTRMLDKVKHITPRDIGEACARSLKEINLKLSYVPKDFDRFKRVVDAAVEDIRERLDSGLSNFCCDAHMVELYFDIRSDVTVLETLVDVGEISVKTLLHERSMLVSQIRKMTMTQGSLELQVAQSRSKLKEITARNQYSELNVL